MGVSGWSSRWTRQPQSPVTLDESHPLGRVLDQVWLGSISAGGNSINGLTAPGPSTTQTASPQGLYVGATGGSLTAISGANVFPFVLVGYGFITGVGGNYTLAALSNSGGG